MDDRKFDDLTRFIGKRASRRAVVKGAAAAALAAVFGRAAAGEENVAEAAVYTQGGVKQRIRVFCNQAGQLCKNSLNPTRRCCYRCAGSGKNARCCETEGYACTKNSDCCNGLICRDPDVFDGVNLKGCFVGGELNPGAQCVENAECESQGCIDEVCCAAEQICDVDPYDDQAAECCDPYQETCTSDGCCPINLECFGQCCDGYNEFCDEYIQECVPLS